MSGLYNVIFKVNPLAAPLLAIIGIDYTTVARFRDCFLNEAGTEIIIYTRTGGGNRPDYQEDNARLAAMPGFIADEDDSFDSTYALFRFEIPDVHDYREVLKTLGPQHGVDPAKRWKETIEAMQNK